MSSGWNSFIDEIAWEALGRSGQMTESVRSKSGGRFTQPRKRKTTFQTPFCTTFDLGVMKPSALRCPRKFWKGLTCQTKSQHSAASLSPSLPPSISLLVRYFITGQHTDPNIDGDFFFSLSHLGQGELSQGLLINCYNNCTKSSFGKWTIALSGACDNLECTQHA